MTKSKTDLWRNERLGLALIGASLIVIFVVVAMLLLQQRDVRLAHLRDEAAGVMTLLTAIPLESHAQIRSAHALTSNRSNELAYAVVADDTGKVLDEMARDGVVIPAAAVESPAERSVTATVAGVAAPIVEFTARLGENGRGGLVRLGYFPPRAGIELSQLPFLGTLALAVFLLTPVFYLLVRQEIRPMRAIMTQMEKIVGKQRIEPQASSASVAAQLERLNGFAELAQSRVAALEAENTRLLTSSKLLGYQKQRLEGVMEALPDAIVLLDESGSAIFANAKVRGVFGVTPQEVVGRTTEDWCKDRKIVDFIHRCEGKSTARQLLEALEFKPATSTEKMYSLRAWPLATAPTAAARYGTLLVFRDVTAENRAAESRGEFVAHLAHELKTPLGVLSMYSESLQMSGGLEEGSRIEAINAITDEVQRLVALIDNLLNITRIEMGSLKIERQRVNLKELLQDAFNHVSRSGREQSLKFVIDVPESLPAASLDKGLLRVALNNLLTNAIKYSNPGGTVTLGAEETPDRLRIYVRDTGIGIRSEDQERIFDRFFRADDEQTRSRTGHGLGLSLARDIVHLHHGALLVESDVGHGSKFSIELWKDTVALRQAS